VSRPSQVHSPLIVRFLKADPLYISESTARFGLQGDFLALGMSSGRIRVGTDLYQLFVATILPITIAALEFAIQGFAEDIQPARSVGDGAAFSSEWSVRHVGISAEQ
jgi:hypothetical protein